MNPRARHPAVLLSAALLGGCSVVGYPAPGPPAGERVAEPRSRSGSPASYEVFGQTYHVLPTADGYEEEGWASWYGSEVAGRRTASGEVFDPGRESAAHRTLPLPTWVEVTNLENGRALVVRVNDRGPFADPDRRIIDLSRAAAERLGLIGPGTARVRVRAVSGYAPGPRSRDAGPRSPPATR